MKRFARREFLNRIDETGVVQPLTKPEIRKIVEIELGGVRKQLASQAMSFVVTDEAKDYIATVGYDTNFGARPLGRAIQNEIADPLAAEPAGLLQVEGPAGAEPRPGARALEPELLTAMVNIQRGLPALINQQVQGFTVDGCGSLTMTAAKGWKAYFGRVLTPEEFQGVEAKLAALKSISPKVDYNSPDLEYVNVMNPASPAVKLRSAKPAPAPSPSPRPAGPTPRPSAPAIQVIPCR